MGRFLTVDPYGRSARTSDPASWNRYTYAGSDPVNMNDPTGLIIQVNPFGPDVPPIFNPPCAYGENFLYDGFCADAIFDWAPEPFKQFAGQNGGAGGGGGGAQLDTRINKEISKAISKSLRWLAKQDCLNFLSGNGAVDPATILNSLESKGDIVVGSLSNKVPNTVLSAITTVPGSTHVPIPNGFFLQQSSVQITINDLAGSFVNGGSNSQATTLLHELGHVICDLYGPSGSNVLPANYGIKPDAGNVSASEANTAAIQQHCH